MRRTPQPSDSSGSSLDRVIEAYREQIDCSLIERNLELTPEERIRQLMELQRFAEELRRSGRETVGSR